MGHLAGTNKKYYGGWFLILLWDPLQAFTYFYLSLAFFLAKFASFLQIKWLFILTVEELQVGGRLLRLKAGFKL